jgi:hypothetical protein
MRYNGRSGEGCGDSLSFLATSKKCTIDENKREAAS